MLKKNFMDIIKKLTISKTRLNFFKRSTVIWRINSFLEFKNNWNHYPKSNKNMEFSFTISPLL